MTYEEWEKKYKPIKNHLDPDQDILFETNGNEFEFISNCDPNKVWTLIDGDEGTYVSSGTHLVNRISYIVTEESHHGEFIDVLDMVYGEEENWHDIHEASQNNT
jgi:hypothetical protein